MAKQQAHTQQSQAQPPTVANAPTDLKTLGSAFTLSSTQLISAGSAMTAQVQAARLASLKRTATAAAAIYGAQSKEATAATATVTTAQTRTAQLQIVSQKVATPPPTVASKGWALHGRVYDANQIPQERYTVFLVDAKKNYLSEYGFSYTDSTGYFLINYPGPASQSALDSAEGKEPEAVPDSEDAQNSGSNSPQIYIQVYDATANPALSSSSGFAPVLGQARYEVLTTPAANQTLGDPPAQVRAVATPQTEPADTATAETTTGKTGRKSGKTRPTDPSEP